MTGVFINARLGSVRLPKKHLIKVNGITYIEYLVKRLQYHFKEMIEVNKLKLFITTSIEPENKKFEEIFDNKGVAIFYGSDRNIPLRHLECAQRNKIDKIIAIEGDVPLFSYHAVEIVYKRLQFGIKISQTKGLPLGMNVMGYTTNFLRRALNGKENNIIETGWGRIFDENKIKTTFVKGFERGKMLRMTLDYPEDALFFKTVIEKTGDKILQINDAELVDIIIANKFDELNAHLYQLYWDNFYKLREKEIW